MIPEQVELTSTMIRMLLTGVTPEQLAWKPAPGRFSIAEVLAHLADAEHGAYAVKYDQFADEAASEISPYQTDQAVADGLYAGRDALASLVLFEERRAKNLAQVRRLKDRTLNHKKAGPISLSHLLNECAFHDLGHIRQIAELVRAQKYHPNMGGYAAIYKVHP